MAITFQAYQPVKALLRFGSKTGEQKTLKDEQSARREWSVWNKDSKTKANHQSDVRGDDYSRYTPANTIAPPATFHTLISPTTIRRLWDLGNTLEQYIENLGRRSLDINWIKDGRTIDQVPMAVFDTETTGLSAYDRIIQLAATPIDPGMHVNYDGEYNTLLHPGYTKKEGNEEMFRIDPGASAVHGIYPEDLVSRPQMEDVLQDITRNILKPRGVLVAYNAKFDVGMLNAAIDRWNSSPHKREYGYVKELDPALVLDPFVLIQRIHPYVSMKKTLSNHYRILMGHELENMHDAQADVEGTVDVLKYVIKYMEKHYVPPQWGQAAEKILKETVFAGDKSTEWRALNRAEKAAFIARFVHDNRASFEQAFGKPAEAPIKPTDLLRFQHGYMAFQSDDQASNLPVFDITLNILGVDASRHWDGSDRLDPEITRQVRAERDEENHAFLLGRFKASFPKEAIATLAQALRPDLKPAAANAKKLAATLSQEVLQQVGENIILPRLLQHTLPNPQDAETLASRTEELKTELTGALTRITQNSLQALADKQAEKQKDAGAEQKPDEAALQSAVNTLVEQGLASAATLQRELGERYFYTMEPLTRPEALIDPAVLLSVSKAAGKRILSTRPVEPRTLAFA